MENELGFQLITRSRLLRLTPAAKRFYRDAGQILELFDVSVAECKELSQKSTGTLTFESLPSYGGIRNEFELSVLKFKKDNPTITVCSTKMLTPRCKTYC